MFLLASKSANCLDLNLVFEKSINIKLVCDLIYLIFSLSKNSENFEIHFLLCCFAFFWNSTSSTANLPRYDAMLLTENGPLIDAKVVKIFLEQYSKKQ